MHLPRPSPNITIGLVGDYNSSVPAHQAIPLALRSAAESLRLALAFEWVPTEEITTASRISSFNGLWCIPASPYRNTEGALLAIRHARENGVPFLGTCGGFQHAVIEYARNMLGWFDAEHAEISPNAVRPVITLLECSLVEASALVRFSPGSRIAAAYGINEATVGYRCRYGLNEQFRSQLLAGPLRVAAEDENGDVRAVELDRHAFFVATLFQPERAALAGQPVPLAAAFLQACAT